MTYLIQFITKIINLTNKFAFSCSSSFTVFFGFAELRLLKIFSSYNQASFTLMLCVFVRKQHQNMSFVSTVPLICYGKNIFSHKNPPSHLLSLQKRISVEETKSQWLSDPSLANNDRFNPKISPYSIQTVHSLFSLAP